MTETRSRVVWEVWVDPQRKSSLWDCQGSRPSSGKDLGGPIDTTPSPRAPFGFGEGLTTGDIPVWKNTGDRGQSGSRLGPQKPRDLPPTSYAFSGSSSVPVYSLQILTPSLYDYLSIHLCNGAPRVGYTLRDTSKNRVHSWFGNNSRGYMVRDWPVPSYFTDSDHGPCIFLVSIDTKKTHKK